MKKVALVFVLAVFVPSLVLAWLAVRSLGDQQFVLERQQSLLYQGVADSVARETSALLAEHQREFARQIEALLADNKPMEAARSFDERLRKDWPLAEVGFAVSLDGTCYAPSQLFGGPEAHRFLLDNERFLTSRESVEVYWDSPKSAFNLSQSDEKNQKRASEEGSDTPQAAAKPDSYANNPAGRAKEQKLTRNVEPQQTQQGMSKQTWSKTAVSEVEFRQLIGASTEGIEARFLQNKLNVMFWYRSPRDPQIVFGALVNLPRLVQGLSEQVKVEPERLRCAL